MLISWWLLRTDGDRPEVIDQVEQHLPDFWATKWSSRTLAETGKPAYDLAAERVTHFRDDGSSEFELPVYHRHRQTEGPLTITALSGWSNETGDEILLTGEVEIISYAADGSNINQANMDELLLHPDDDFAETRSPVTITTREGVTRGVGMHVNSRLGTLVLLSNVKGRYERLSK